MRGPVLAHTCCYFSFYISFFLAQSINDVELGQQKETERKGNGGSGSFAQPFFESIHRFADWPDVCFSVLMVWPVDGF
jgi:hypothetical protein